MSRERTDEDQRRYDAEEERHHWETVEEERRAEEERAIARQTAIETMERWFFEQFEDPQNDTPRDSETQTFIFPWGGPFEAGDVLHGAFGDEFSEEWIIAAAERIERDGTTEWAPASSGDYYEHPEPDDPEDALETTKALVTEALQRLTALEAMLSEAGHLPPQLGHNNPPETIGMPPYTAEVTAEAASTIAETRRALAVTEPDAAQLATLATRFEKLGTKVGPWLAKKGDLAVDELIKNSIRVVTWSKALAGFAAVAEVLFQLARHLS